MPITKRSRARDITSAQDAANKPKMQKISFEIPAREYQQFKVKVLQNGENYSNVLRAFIRNY